MGRFVPLSPEEFLDLLERFDFTRKIDAVHMHHTWRPNHGQWRGEDSVEAMWRFHTQTQHWSDIAQHVTIAPDGVIWTGRDWNRPPASAVGFNGNGTHGPFMFETVGDFDAGSDRLEGRQREAAITVIAGVQRRFGLATESLRFHNMMTDQKTCPGTGVDYETVLNEVRAERAKLDGGGTRAWRGWAAPGFSASAGRVTEAMRGLGANGTRGADPHDAELPESAMSGTQQASAIGLEGGTRAAPAATRDGRRDALTPAMLAALRPHVINLNQGRFSSEGLFRTEAADVDAIFAVHLEHAVKKAAAESPPHPLRIVVWAHGGLIDEASGLWIAHQQIDWWRRNGVYPIHFVWETGFCDALRQILAGTRAAAPRDLADVGDAVVERLVRTLGGEKIWSAMKRSAELSVAPQGGARHVAARLAEFVAKHPEVELHAVGHSAGSIFHAHFLPTAFELGVPAFQSLQLLAPAIRVDTFKERLLALIPDRVRDVTMFTMARDWEEADRVLSVYQKSLLYLIHYALEPERRTPILGLEVSAREDDAVARLFGLTADPAPAARVVWAVTEAATGRSASTSQTHGGFDNDRATMNSVAGRIRGADVAETFPDAAVERGARLWQQSASVGVPPVATTVTTPAYAAPSNVTAPPPPAVHVAGGGRLRALCIGINAYRGQPLNGCVADAEAWARTLQALRFECDRLFDERATRLAIIDGLQSLIATSRPGDVVVFQYAGHGTHLDDLDGDEADGQDEALCPYDIDDGAFLLDDDVAAIMASIPDGVNVTCFLDCCHSGTATRFMVGPPAPGRSRGASLPRFLRPTPTLQAEHRSYRARASRAVPVPGRSAATMRNVVFAACDDPEVAWESEGHGEFTLRATQILAGGVQGLSHEEFQRRVTAAFGAQPRQHPQLDCADGARSGVLLAPHGATLASGSRGLAANGATAGTVDVQRVLVAQALRGAADALAAPR